MVLVVLSRVSARFLISCLPALCDHQVVSLIRAFTTLNEENNSLYLGGLKGKDKLQIEFHKKFESVMPPKNSKIAKACRAMKGFGISEVETKAALKKLLELYEDNWDFIEADDYKELFNFIVPDNKKPDEERMQPKVKGALMRVSKRVKSKNKQAPLYDKTEVIERPTKRYCTRQQKNQPLSFTDYSDSSLKRTPTRSMHEKYHEESEESEESEDSQPLVRKPRRSHINQVCVPRNNLDPVSSSCRELVPSYCPEREISPNLICEDNFSDSDGSDVSEDMMKFLQLEPLNQGNTESVSDWSQVAVTSSSPMKSPLISCSSQQSGFHSPNFDISLEMMEERCMKSDRIGECTMAIGTDLPENKPELRTFNAQGQGSKSNDLGYFNELFVDQSLIRAIPAIPKHIAFGCFEGLHILIGFKVRDISDIFGESAKRLRLSEGQKSSKLCKVEVGRNYHSSLGVVESSAFNIDDITRGEERLEISLKNGRNAKLPTFFYISQNLIYNSACVSFAIANVFDEGCCSKCSGDCLTSLIPCLCAIANGGECAYTPGGLVNEKFLEECISMKCETKKHPYFYCKECPLVRSKNEKSSVACKGHLLRKFIKECWYKCGCNKSCGNRIVQKGIAVKLQVFLTPEGKGLGLRTLEALPRGAFVCEYVGEIVTINELHERNSLSLGKEYSYRVLLDADWGSQDVLKDEKALCLDSTVYGNVARFINHRCSDATLVEIPVEVETPDRHYYHLALFTTRDVAAMEELTWDYGIAFHDCDYPVKPFQCLCGSRFCRDHSEIKRAVTYVRRRRKDGKGKEKDGVLDHLAKDLAPGTRREEIQVDTDALMQLDVVPSTGVLRMEVQEAPDPSMQLQVVPSTPGIEPGKTMHCLEWEPVGDISSSSSTTCYLAKEVADLRAQLEAVKAAREKDQINYEAHRAQFQAVMQQLSTLLPGFKVPQAPLQMQLEQNVDGESHMLQG